MSALRIKRLSLTDFRAFPGPAPADFNLDGKNLLVYGENGAGKSSIFHALGGFFSLKPQRELREHKNVFSGQPDADCKVAVEFTNGSPTVEWTVTRHPIYRKKLTFDGSHRLDGSATIGGLAPDPRVTEAALRRACLDYRSLLDTNYKQGSGSVNLFDIAVEHLLRDYPVAVSGGTSTTVGELWSTVLNSKPDKHTSVKLVRIVNACGNFNTAFRNATAALVPLVNELMQLLGWQDVTLNGFTTPGLTYNTARLKQDRKIDGQELIPELTFRNHPLQTPQLFLNEARLSALGLAIYLAGRLACTPTANTTALKLLVLDDVLIGLDHSNRLPVLDVLKTKFSDWQIVLLTHDRNWFDLARSHLSETDWKCVEIYEGDNAAKAPMPILHPTQSRPARALLEKAKELIKTPYVEASANYTRQAFELGVRAACEIKRIEMRYCTDPKTHQAQDFLDKLKSWTATGSIKQTDWNAAIQRLEMLKNVVMNPYSHPDAPNIPKIEVEQAIQAVEEFLDLAGKK
jgi:energy-coupling factor transporter ATP-binding protein EcfA2